MPNSVVPLGDCAFYAETNDNGMFVGRCRQFPDIRTRPTTARLDAIDDVITATREKLRRLDAAATNISKGARHGT